MLTAMVIIYDDDVNEDYRRDGASAVLGNDLVVIKNDGDNDDDNDDDDYDDDGNDDGYN